VENRIPVRCGSQGVVVNIRTGARYDVYIGRGSVWGNPFTHKPLADTKATFQVSDRQAAIEKYEEWIMTQPELLGQINKLKGLTLGCYCRPLPCHGDVLIRLANAT
jgi:hypothetical protein